MMIPVLAEEKPIQRRFKAFDKSNVGGRHTLFELGNEQFIRKHVNNRHEKWAI
jgi:hypothetical protein